MSEDGPAPAQAGHAHIDMAAVKIQTTQNKDGVDHGELDDFPLSPRGASTPNPFSRRQTSLDIDDYFVRS